MYLRATSRQNKDGSSVRYLQLAHNQWDAEKGRSEAKVLYNFGREDQLDPHALGRLARSITRLLGPAQALATAADPEMQFVDSRPLGGIWVLDQLWRRLGIDATLRRLLATRKLDPRAERVLFALVANRALEPLSKLAATQWVAERVAIEGLEAVDEDTCYRAMDWLLEVEAELSQAVYFATAELLDLEVDLLFFDTTSTYFQTDQADPSVTDEATGEVRVGFRTWGHSKDHRPDLPQVVIGMAVTRTGIPVRVWTWPGNTGDQALIRQARDDLRGWKLSRVVWVADRGFSSAENRRYLQRAGGHYIIGEKLRAGQANLEALARPGRYHKVRDNLEVKEVWVGEGETRRRFVVCRNLHEAARDRARREKALARIADELAALERKRTADERRDAEALLLAHPSLGRYLTRRRARLVVDQHKVKAEEHVDGKFLLSSSDDSLAADEIALGYKQLIEVERGWRTLKHTLDLRPVYHHKQERIRAHVLLCFLALLLTRVIEVETSQTWPTIRRQLERIHLGEFHGSAGRVLQRTEATPAQLEILRALQVDEPPRFLAIEPAKAA